LNSEVLPLFGVPPGEMHQRGFHRSDTVSSSNNDGHRLAPAYGDGDVLDPDRDRIAPDHAFVQHLDPGALDEASSINRLSSSTADSAEPASEAAMRWMTPE